MGAIGKAGVSSFKFESLDENTYQNPLSSVSGAIYKKIVNADTSNRPSSKQELDISKIHSIQESLDKENLESMMKMSISQLKQLGDITIYKIDNTYYVDDGNHRLAALKAKGVKSMNFNVVDLNRRK